MKVVYTDKAPAAIGPYSQAIILNGVLFTSGQIPVDPATGEISGDTIEVQAEQVMKNLGEVLKEAGSSFENAVKTTCFLADMGDFAKFNEVYAKYFVNKPARSCVAVKTLPTFVRTMPYDGTWFSLYGLERDLPDSPGGLFPLLFKRKSCIIANDSMGIF